MDLSYPQLSVGLTVSFIEVSVNADFQSTPSVVERNIWTVSNWLGWCPVGAEHTEFAHVLQLVEQLQSGSQWETNTIRPLTTEKHYNTGKCLKIRSLNIIDCRGLLRGNIKSVFRQTLESWCIPTLSLHKFKCTQQHGKMAVWLRFPHSGSVYSRDAVFSTNTTKISNMMLSWCCDPYVLKITEAICFALWAEKCDGLKRRSTIILSNI